ncbi:MAG: hypothetical protein QG573_2424 [Acidobacteriota bacterium]|nr:hypothetical protein [Acidobacteriota bacterium]
MKYRRSLVLLPAFALLCLGTAGGLAPAGAEEGVRKERVQFARGESAATLAGEIHGWGTVEYQLGAGAGQTMTVSLETADSATYFNVFAPGAEAGRDAALFAGQTGGSRFEGKLPYPGDYRIEVFMMRSAARRAEHASYKLTVRIEGTPDPTVKAPARGPWPVDTDASGDLPCSTGGETLDLQCPFRVKRNRYGATLWVVRAGETREAKSLTSGALRVLYFESLDGKAGFTTNDAGAIGARRVDDSWIVTVGERELYWIPDAAIWGG